MKFIFSVLEDMSFFFPIKGVFIDIRIYVDIFKMDLEEI